jgi:colanic acid/amylovoran biosynthesis protein
MINLHIKGGDYNNFGDQLMLKTLIEQLKSINSESKLAVENHYCTYDVRSNLGLYLLMWEKQKMRFSGLIADPIIKRYSKPLGLIQRDQINAIVDISGFAYTDYWGPQNTINMANYAEKQNKRGAKIVLMPQAYGPFESTEIQENFLRLAAYTSIIYTRDKVSYNAIKNIGVDTDKVKIAPDITTISPMQVPDWCKSFSHYVCIIPNRRMFEQNTTTKSNYLNVLGSAAKLIQEKGLKPLFLVFEKQDFDLVRQIKETTNAQIYISNTTDPVIIKGIISKAKLVIGSRYHSLVSALSQSVPSIGTSWAHKYEQLFSDYNMANYLIKELRIETLNDFVNYLLETENNIKVRKLLSEAADNMINQTHKMFMKVFNEIGYPINDVENDCYPEEVIGVNS